MRSHWIVTNTPPPPSALSGKQLVVDAGGVHIVGGSSWATGTVNMTLQTATVYRPSNREYIITEDHPTYPGKLACIPAGREFNTPNVVWTAQENGGSTAVGDGHKDKEKGNGKEPRD